MKFLVLFLVLIQVAYLKKLRFLIDQFRHGARGTFYGKYLNNTTPMEDYFIG